jgi:hypothetical protein
MTRRTRLALLAAAALIAVPASADAKVFFQLSPSTAAPGEAVSAVIPGCHAPCIPAAEARGGLYLAPARMAGAPVSQLPWTRPPAAFRPVGAMSPAARLRFRVPAVRPGAYTLVFRCTGCGGRPVMLVASQPFTVTRASD